MNSTSLRAILSGLVLAAASARAALVIPGADGSDGTLNITTNTVIDLSQAVTGAWDTNNAAHAGKGVYDPAKWAVVFKYSEINIASNATVTFKNHASRAPVVWLVNGNVTIAGTVDLSGGNYTSAPRLAEPGPGGFRGGMGNYASGVSSSPGLGAGGGGSSNGAGYGGGYGTSGINQANFYGNPALVPLLGGSGGGGRNNGPQGGGGGGGAILIACAQGVSVTGSVIADGGLGVNGGGGSPVSSGSGSGGGIRVVAQIVSGGGKLTALGASSIEAGGLGRIRIERVINDNFLTVVPSPSVVDLQDGATALLWPPTSAPEVRIVSIQGKAAPVDPRAEFGTIGADVTLPRTEVVVVFVESRNVEQASVMKVRVTPRMNGNYQEKDASVETVISENPLVIRWKAELPVQDGYAAVQVKVVRP